MFKFMTKSRIIYEPESKLKIKSKATYMKTDTKYKVERMSQVLIRMQLHEKIMNQVHDQMYFHTSVQVDMQIADLFFNIDRTKNRIHSTVIEHYLSMTMGRAP